MWHGQSLQHDPVYKVSSPIYDNLLSDCLHFVGCHPESSVALTFYRHHRFNQLNYIRFFGVHTNYTKYDIQCCLRFGITQCYI